MAVLMVLPSVASELAASTEEGSGSPNLSKANAHPCCHARKEGSLRPSHLKFRSYQQDSVNQDADRVAAFIEN